jgi:hypothetical protein
VEHMNATIPEHVDDTIPELPVKDLVSIRPLFSEPRTRDHFYGLFCRMLSFSSVNGVAYRPTLMQYYRRNLPYK